MPREFDFKRISSLLFSTTREIRLSSVTQVLAIVLAFMVESIELFLDLINSCIFTDGYWLLIKPVTIIDKPNQAIYYQPDYACL
jgi:hypothetical protein